MTSALDLIVLNILRRLFFPPSDHGPSIRCDCQSCRPVGGPAERSLGGPTRPQRLPLSSQIPDPLQTGGQPRLEGKGQGRAVLRT